MFTIEVEREDDGRWIAEVADLPGVLAYGQSHEEARRPWHGESWPIAWNTANARHL